jgi:hypothetical protein
VPLPGAPLPLRQLVGRPFFAVLCASHAQLVSRTVSDIPGLSSRCWLRFKVLELGIAPAKASRQPFLCVQTRRGVFASDVLVLTDKLCMCVHVCVCGNACAYVDLLAYGDATPKNKMQECI